MADRDLLLTRPAFLLPPKIGSFKLPNEWKGPKKKRRVKSVGKRERKKTYASASAPAAAASGASDASSSFSASEF